MKQLGGIDAALVYLESPSMPMHTGGMLIYGPGRRGDAPVTAQEVSDRVRRALAETRALSQRLVKVPFHLDLPYWVDGEVDLEHHVLHDPLREPGSWRQLCDQAAAFLGRPLDMSRPLWELCFIDGLDAVDGVEPGSFALVFKVHHAVVDGVGGLELVASLHEALPGEARTGAVGAAPEGDSTSWFQLLCRPLTPRVQIGDNAVTLEVPDVVKRSLRLVNVVGRLGAGRARRLLSAPEEQPKQVKAAVPETRFNKGLQSGRVVGGVRLDLAQVRELRQALPGTTVNDVCVTTIGGALRRYLLEVNELPSESLIAVMPMSVRTAEEGQTGGNLLAVSTIALGTHLSDPVERLNAVCGSTRQGKAVQRGSGARRAVTVSEALPAGLLGVAGLAVDRLGLASRFRLVNTGVSNVPGPREPLFFCDAELTAMYGFALVVSGLGLMHMVTSVGSVLTLGFQADSAMLPDPEHYEACLRQAFRELQEAVGCSA